MDNITLCSPVAQRIIEEGRRKHYHFETVAHAEVPTQEEQIGNFWIRKVDKAELAAISKGSLKKVELIERWDKIKAILVADEISNRLPEPAEIEELTPHLGEPTRVHQAHPRSIETSDSVDTAGEVLKAVAITAGVLAVVAMPVLALAGVVFMAALKDPAIIVITSDNTWILCDNWYHS